MKKGKCELSLVERMAKEDRRDQIVITIGVVLVILGLPFVIISGIFNSYSSEKSLTYSYPEGLNNNPVFVKGTVTLKYNFEGCHYIVIDNQYVYPLNQSEYKDIKVGTIISKHLYIESE